MNTQLATTEAYEAPARRTWRVRLVGGLGPATVAAGFAWALFQPYRITLLHPRDLGFWWLFVEPPLLVVAVGLLFAWLVAPGLVRDLEDVET
jgi:hypothetical protein